MLQCPTIFLFVDVGPRVVFFEKYGNHLKRGFEKLDETS